MSKPKGWEKESLRHSEAKRYGRASPSDKRPRYPSGQVKSGAYPGEKYFVDPTHASAAMRAIEYFQFNVSRDEWVRRFQESGGEKWLAEHMWDEHMTRGGGFGVSPEAFGNTLGHADKKVLLIIADMAIRGGEKHGGISVGAYPDEISKKQVAALLEAAQLFEYNVTKDEWNKLWSEAVSDGVADWLIEGDYKSDHMRDHVWGKFINTHHRTIFNTMGNLDPPNHVIVTKMLMLRAQEEDNSKIGHVLD